MHALRGRLIPTHRGPDLVLRRPRFAGRVHSSGLTLNQSIGHPATFQTLRVEIDEVLVNAVGTPTAIPRERGIPSRMLGKVTLDTALDKPRFPLANAEGT